MAAMLISAQAVDFDGNVLSGAKLNVYDAGTSTPRAIYQTSSLASGASSTNPAVATSAGGIAVWVDDTAGDIKVSLTNSAGTTTYYQQDNIDPTLSNLVIYPLGGSDQTTGTGDTVQFAGLTLTGAMTATSATFSGNVTMSSANFDLDGNTLILDSDGDSTITTPADDQVRITLGGSAAFDLTASNIIINSNTITNAQLAYVAAFDQGLATSSSVQFAGLTLSGNLDMQGNRIILDADNDSYIDVPSDDNVSIVVGGTTVQSWDATDTNISIINGVTFSPTGAVLGQALGYPNSTTTLEPYTPAGAGDLLAAAAETITGNWTVSGDWTFSGDQTFTGDVDFSGITSPSGVRDDLLLPKIYNVKDYGALVDGATDDSTAVQAAADAISSAGGGYLYFPAGTCICDAITLATNTTVIGDGRGVSTVKLPASAQKTNPMFYNTNIDGNTPARSDKDIQFIGLTIDGNSANQTNERWLQDWNDNSAISDPENDYTANGGGIGDGGAANIADDDYIALSQSGSSGVALTLANTTMPSALVVTATNFAAARRLRVVSAGDDSGITFAVVGTDFAGNALNETITGANAGTAEGQKWFKTVTSVTPSGNTASTVEVGIEEYDIGSAASAGRRNPNFTTTKLLIRFRKVEYPAVINCEIKNHIAGGVSDQGCLGFRFENNIIDNVGKKDGPYFPVYTAKYTNEDAQNPAYAPAENPRIIGNYATNLERGFVHFLPGSGGILANNVVDGFGEAALYLADANIPITDDDGIATSQTPGGAGSLTLDGVRVYSGSALFTSANVITITSAGNLSARTFTITGTDARGDALTETITGPNATTVSSEKMFETVTDVSIDAAAGAAVTVGYRTVPDAAVVAHNTVKNGVLTDIICFGVEISSGAENIIVRHNHFEAIDESAIEAGGATEIRIHGNTFKNCVRISTGTVPYGPFAERYSFNIGGTPIAGDALSRADNGYLNLGTKTTGCENMLVTENHFIEEYDTGAPAVFYKKSGDNNLSGYNLLANNVLESDTAWTLISEQSNVFVDSTQLVVFNNRGSTEARYGYPAVFQDTTVGALTAGAIDADGSVHIFNNSAGTMELRLQQASSINGSLKAQGGAGNDVALSGNRFGILDGASGAYMRFNGSNKLNTTSGGATVTGSMNATVGYEVGGTQVVTSQQSAITSLTDNTGVTHDDTLADIGTLTTLTNSTGGTADDTLAAVGDTSTTDQSGVINDNFTELFDSVAELVTAAQTNEDNTADVAAKVEEILGVLRTHGLIAT